MTDEKWEQLVEKLKAAASDVSVYTEDLVVETGSGAEKRGTRDVVEFANANGVFKLVRENKPVVLDKKMHFSHRQGDSARTEYVLSNTELTHTLLLFQDDGNGEWEQVDISDLGAIA